MIIEYIVCDVCLSLFCFKNSNNMNKTNKSYKACITNTQHTTCVFIFLRKIMAAMVRKIEYFVAVDESEHLKPARTLYHCDIIIQRAIAQLVIDDNRSTVRTILVYHHVVAPWYTTWCRFIARKKMRLSSIKLC